MHSDKQIVSAFNLGHVGHSDRHVSQQLQALNCDWSVRASIAVKVSAVLSGSTVACQ